MFMGVEQARLQTEDRGRPVRADALRNRKAIIDAAAAIFAERGHGVDVREIARCAGVGMGTLYRHFPTKDALLDTVLIEDFAAWARSAREAAACQSDPWLALAAFCEDALVRQSCHRAVLERFATDTDTGVGAAVAACQRDLHPVIDRLVDRCHQAGVLRGGVSGQDISLLLIALGRVAQSSSPQSPQPWRRLLRITLDGLRSCHQALTQAPPTTKWENVEDAHQ